MPDRNRITDRREAELSKAGPDLDHPPQEHRQGRLHRRAIGLQAAEVLSTTEATAVGRICPRAFPTCSRCRASRIISKCMVRDKIGSTKEKDQLEKWLNEWITLYVDGDPKNSSEEVKARKPLAAAKVNVIRG